MFIVTNGNGKNQVSRAAILWVLFIQMVLNYLFLLWS